MFTITDADYARREIEYNLKELNKTVDKGLGKEVASFLPIFQKYVTALEEVDSNMAVSVQKQYQTICSKMYDKGINILDVEGIGDHIEVPRMSGRIDLLTIADEYRNGKTQTGLVILSTLGYEAYRIKGDGDCLFRTIAADWVRASKNSQAEYQQDCARLDQFADHFRMQTEWNAVKAVTDRLHTAENSLNFEQVMKDESMSDLITSLLRKMACAYNEKNGGDTFEAHATASKGSKETYLAAMQTPGELAGQPEIQALAKLLNRNIRVFHADALGELQDPLSEHLLTRAAGANRETAALYRPGHYDLVIKLN